MTPRDRQFLLGLLGEHWPARRGEAAVAGGGWPRPRLRHQRAAALEQVRPQRVQVSGGPRAIAKDSSVEVLERRKIVMIGRREGGCRQDKLTPSLDSGLLCWVNNTGERRRVEVGVGGGVKGVKQT